MNDRGLSVLEQYDIGIYHTRRGRGAMLCETEAGLMLLKELHTSEKRLEMQSRLLDHIDEAGHMQAEVIIRNKEGMAVSRDRDETPYVLKRWFDARECDVRNEQEVLAAVRNLAKLHKHMQLDPITDEDRKMACAEDLICEYERHNREMKKVCNYIRNKRRKTEFEICFMQNFAEFFRQGEQALERLRESAYEDLRLHSIESGLMCHGDYNHHNVLMLKKEIATTNFERCYIGVQVADLYQFMRKIMEKQNWNLELGRKMLDSYRSVRPLSNEEVWHLGLRLSYPEKFWKLGNHYYNSDKAWIPGKNIEKLEILARQNRAREIFLNSIFT